MSNHAFLTYGVIAGKTFFDGLPENYRTLIRESAKKSAAYQLGLIEERDAGFLKTIKDAGVNVTELTPEERAAFQHAMQPVYDWFVANVENGRKYLDLVRK